MRTATLWVVVLALLPGQGFAGDQDPAAKVWDSLLPSWDRISAKLVAYAGEERQKLLADLAFAAVSSRQCEGLDLDRNKFKADFDSLNDGQYQALSGEAKAEYGPRLMTYYGVYVGLLTAEGVLDNAAFCAYARDKQAKGEGKYWLATEGPAK